MISQWYNLLMLAILLRDVGSYSYAWMGYANPHAVTSVGGTTYTYDNNGNVTAIGSLDYTWDWRNRLASAERSGGGITSNGYDHAGQRVFKATGTATTSYPNRYYNLATTTGAATSTKHIFAPDGTLLATVVGASTTATTTYLHPDHLGGTNVTTDEDGEVTQTLDYYPYGSQRIASGSVSEQRRFIGEEYDPDTEFSYLNARYYQGSRGQFMSQDPVFLGIGSGGQDERSRQKLNTLLTDPQVLNAYSYSRNNPIILIDKSGKIVVLPLIYAGIQIYGAYSLGYHFGEVLNAELLYRDLYSPQERSGAQFAFGFDALTSTAGLGLEDDLGKAFLTLSSDIMSGLERLDKAGDETRKKYDQSRAQSSVNLTSSRTSGRSMVGSSYNGVYSGSAISGRGGGSSSLQGNGGGNGMSSTQIGTLQNFLSVVNASSFNAQAFVNALQAVVKAFGVK